MSQVDALVEELRGQIADFRAELAKVLAVPRPSAAEAAQYRAAAMYARIRSDVLTDAAARARLFAQAVHFEAMAKLAEAGTTE